MAVRSLGGKMFPKRVDCKVLNIVLKILNNYLICSHPKFILIFSGKLILVYVIFCRRLQHFFFFKLTSLKVNFGFLECSEKCIMDVSRIQVS